MKPRTKRLRIPRKINKENPKQPPTHPPRHRIIKLVKTKYKEKILRHPGAGGNILHAEEKG